MRCRFEEIEEMVLVKLFKNFAEADKFIKDHSAANEEFVVGCKGNKPAVFCKVWRRIYR